MGLREFSLIASSCLLGKTKTVCKVFILATVFFFLGFIYPAEARYSCGTIAGVFKSLLEDGYAYFSTAENGENGISISHFMTEDGRWKLVGVDKDLNACVIMQGSNWQFLIMRKI